MTGACPVCHRAVARALSGNHRANGAYARRLCTLMMHLRMHRNNARAAARARALGGSALGATALRGRAG